MKNLLAVIGAILVASPVVAQGYFGFGVGVPKAGIGVQVHRDYQSEQFGFGRVEIEWGLPYTSLALGAGWGLKFDNLDVGIYSSLRYGFANGWPLTTDNVVVSVGPELGFDFGVRVAGGYRPWFNRGYWYYFPLGTLYVTVEWPGVEEH